MRSRLLRYQEYEDRQMTVREQLSKELEQAPESFAHMGKQVKLIKRAKVTLVILS